MVNMKTAWQLMIWVEGFPSCTNSFLSMETLHHDNICLAIDLNNDNFIRKMILKLEFHVSKMVVLNH